MKCIAGTGACHLSMLMFVVMLDRPSFDLNLPFPFGGDFIDDGH
jgi:hypothetical protein